MGKHLDVVKRKGSTHIILSELDSLQFVNIPDDMVLELASKLVEAWSQPPYACSGGEYISTGIEQRGPQVSASHVEQVMQWAKESNARDKGKVS